MVRWASCPLWGRYSEGEWPLRGLEAHATKGGGARARGSREWCCWLPLSLPLSLSLPLNLSLPQPLPLSLD
jgi:hypothetical protein